ncbi:MAG: alpha-glucosidase [Spirochaetia bacterium]|nr:alpha-glucosidase [Spirochaetia bacterium]
MRCVEIPGGFALYCDDRELLRHTVKAPCIALGKGRPDVTSKSGVFHVHEHQVVKTLLPEAKVTVSQPLSARVTFGDLAVLTITEQPSTACLELTFEADRIVYNRFWIDITAEADERIYGGGELFDRQDLRGSGEPLWISEPGVGRRKDLFTLSVAAKTGHFPRWYNTNFAAPSWISSTGKVFLSESSAYGKLDFSKKTRHTYYSWDIPQKIIIGSKKSLKEALSTLSDLIGRQPKLPGWAYDGMWLGMQGGREITSSRVKKAQQAGCRIGAIWCQDWEGIRMTSFGKQLRWCWEYDPKLYEELPEYIKELRAQGIRYLGYTNTFLTPGSSMFDEADRKGYLIKRPDGENYPVYVPFDPGMMVDFTNPEACTWIKEILKKNLMEIGISGWMADFGEYIPGDAVLHSQESGLTYHNRYPADWARINYEAVHEAGLEDEVIYFMRAGALGAIPYMSCFWTGDQLVDWSREDGFPSAINASLVAGVSGIGYVHSDLGGYTTLGPKKRTRELLIRWAEYAAFTQVMRSHEGNRPQNNVQFDSDDELLSHVSRMTGVFAALRPYHEALSEEYQQTGIPPMRMMQLEYPAEIKELEAWPYQYLYGSDLLVAPVIKPDRRAWKVRLPDDQWVHLWSGTEYRGGCTVTVSAPWGEPPVFYRAGSSWKDLFKEFAV